MPDEHRATTEAVAAFNAGRDLAVEYIRAAQASGTYASTCSVDHVVYPAGLLRPFLDRLIAEPELIDGFDAMLSSFVQPTGHSRPVLDRMGSLRYGQVYGPDFEMFDDDDQPVSRQPQRTRLRLVSAPGDVNG